MTKNNVKFVGGGVTVFVGTGKFKKNFTNAVRAIPLPTTDATPKETLLVNLNKVEKRFTITGYLGEGKLDVSETHTTADDKEAALTTMFELGQTIVMTWNSISYNIAVDKYDIEYTAMDEGSSLNDGQFVYDVIVTCVLGGDAL